MKHVNLYTYSSAKSTKAAKIEEKAVGYVLEYKTTKGAVTRTETILLSKLHKENEEITSNHAHLLVVLAALRRINTRTEMDIYTDCRFLLNVFKNGWLQQWKDNKWNTSTGKPVQYAEDWQELFRLTMEHEITIHLCEPHPYRSWLEHEVEIDHKFMKN